MLLQETAAEGDRTACLDADAMQGPGWYKCQLCGPSQEHVDSSRHLTNIKHKELEYTNKRKNMLIFNETNLVETGKKPR